MITARTHNERSIYLSSVLSIELGINKLEIRRLGRDGPFLRHHDYLSKEPFFLRFVFCIWQLCPLVGKMFSSGSEKNFRYPTKNQFQIFTSDFDFPICIFKCRFSISGFCFPISRYPFCSNFSRYPRY